MARIREVTTYLELSANKIDEVMTRRHIRDRNDVYLVKANMYDDFAKVVHGYYTLIEANCNEDFDW